MTRVIAGVARGRRLRVPTTGTRPTTDRVREAMFSTIESMLRSDDRAWGQMQVLDLYAGSGALGLEALSRGARAVTLVERGREAVRTINENVKVVALPGATVLPLPVARVVDRPSSESDLVLVDPPYDVPAERVIAELQGLADAGWIAVDAVIVVERPAEDEASPLPPGWILAAQRRYGDTVLWYGRARRADGGEEPHA